MAKFAPEEDAKRRMVVLLRTYRHAAGFGACEFEVENLGKYRGWLDDRLRTGFVISDLLRALKVLEVTPAEFFREIFGEDAPQPLDPAALVPNLPGLRQEPPNKQAARLWAEKQQKHPHQAKVTAARIRLDELDKLRYTAATSVIQEIDTWLLRGDLPRCLLPETLGVEGSAYRMAHNLDKAEILIRQGLGYADEVGDCTTVGSLYQRLSMVSWNRPDYDAALLENCQAIANHGDAENSAGIACATVDRGIILGSKGLFERSTEAFKRGLRNLGDDDSHNRFAALQGIAHNLIETSQPAEALLYLGEAEEISVNKSSMAKLVWVHGCTFSKAGHHEQAIAKISIAVDQLMEFSPIEAALAHIDLSEAFIRAGQPHKAHANAAETLDKFTGSLGSNKIARAAMTELAYIGWCGEVTLALLADMRTRVRRAQATPLGVTYGP